MSDFDDVVVRGGKVTKRKRKRKQRTGRGFTGKFPKGGRPAHKISVMNARKDEQRAHDRARAWRMFVDEGMTFVQIGAAMGFSNEKAWRLCEEARRELKSKGLLDEEMVRARQQANLDAIRAAHIKKVGKKVSADIVIRTLEREARMHGLDRHAQAGYSAEQVMGLLRLMVGLFTEIVADPESRRKFIAGIRGKVAPALAPAVKNQPIEAEVVVSPIHQDT